MTAPPAYSQPLGQLVSHITKLEQRIAQLERNSRATQLDNSSVENGSVTFNDANGNPAVILGTQADGTVAHVSVVSTVPNPPSTPSVTPGLMSVIVGWDGLMNDGSTPLSDFAVIQVHLSTISGFTPSAASYQTMMQGASTVTISGLNAGLTYYCLLIAENVAGNMSAPSAQGSAVASAIPPNNLTALTASLLGNVGVLNANPYFWGGDPTGWNAFNGNFSVTATPAAGAPYKYAGVFGLTTSGGAAEESSVPFGAIKSTQYLLTAWVFSSTSSVNIGFDWQDSSGAYLSTTIQTITVTPSTWTQVTTVQTSDAAAAAGYARLSPVTVSGTLQFQGVLVLPQVPGTLVQAGTITATQIASGIVVAGIVNGTLVEGARFVGFGTTGEVLMYTGTPAVGNLNASVSPVSGNDSVITGGGGNAYVAGIAAYAPAAAASYIQMNDASHDINGGAPALVMATGVSAETATNGQAASIATWASGTAGTTQQMFTWFSGPKNAADQKYAAVTFQSSQTNLAAGHTYRGALLAISGGVGNFINTWDDKGFVTFVAASPAAGSTLQGNYGLTQTDNAFLTQTNITTFSRIHNAAWSIPAGDPLQNVLYRMTIFGTGVWEAQTLSFRIAAFGIFLAPFTVGAAEMGAGISFQYNLVATMIISQAGASGIISGSIALNLAQVGSNQLTAGGTNAAGGFVGSSAVGSVANPGSVTTTMLVQAQFGATNASQSISSNGSLFERITTG